MVTKLRHRLVDESVRAGTLVGAWVRTGIPEIVQEEQLLQSIRDKSKRPNNGGKGKVKAVASEAESSDVELVDG